MVKWVEPKVFKLGESTIHREGLVEFLKALGALDWMQRQDWYEKESLEGIDPAAVLIEIAGRSCYKSFGLGLNPNITRIRQERGDYLDNLLRKGDGSVIEHPSVQWAFVDVSRVFCYAEDMEVLTTEGWKAWPLIRGDELFASMTENRELVFESATEWYVSDYSGDMYHVQSQSVDMMVTPNHRMWVQPIDTQAYRRGEQPFQLVPAIDLLHKRVRYQKGGVVWRRETPSSISIPGTDRGFRRSDTGTDVVRHYNGTEFDAYAFARFLGWFITEGSLGRQDTSINLSQNPGGVLDEMSSGLAAMGLRVMNVRSGRSINRRLTSKNVGLCDWLKTEVGTGAVRKRVPGIVHGWSPSLISVFLDAAIAGDGNVHRSNGHKVLYTSSKQLADGIQILALKTGLTANIRVDRRVGSHRIFDGTVITKTLPNYIVSFSDSREFPHVNIHLNDTWPNRHRTADGYDDRMVFYAGRVYCVRVPHGLLYVRRNGKACWSGNTHELVRHRVGTAISQESLRYVRPKELRMTLVPGSELARLSNLEEMTRELEAQEERYLRAAERMIPEGMAFDDKKAWTSALRRFLPDGIATNIVWTANHRTLRWVLEMRTSEGAEVEMRYVFDKVGQILQRDYPLLYRDFKRIPHEDGVGARWIPQTRSKV
jgi:hypothetical protein